jgi:hypothetical protein
MGKKSGLFAAVALLFVIAGALSYFAYKKLGRHPTAGLASVPRDVVAVIEVDSARLRALPITRRVRMWLLTQPDFARDWQPMVAGCGFDPLDRVDDWVLAFDRGSIASGPENGVVSVASGHLTATDSMRCMGSIARMFDTRSQIVPVAPIGNHPVLAFVGPSNTLGDAPARLSVLPDRVVIASSGVMQRALGVVDRREPGADRNDLLRSAVGALGDNLIAYGVVDVQAIFAALPHDVTDLLSVMAAANPSGNGMTAISGTTAFGVGLQQMSGGGLRFVAVSMHRSPTDAQAAMAIVNQSLAFARAGVALQLTHEESEYVRRVTERAARDPSIAPQIPALQQTFTLFNALPDRLHVRVDGQTLREEIEITGAEATTLENGVHAFAACEQSFDRALREEATPPPIPTPPPPPVPITAPTRPLRIDLE